MDRNNLCQRRISSSGRTLPADCFDRIVSYLDSIHEKVKSYNKKSILGFDESSFYMDAIGNFSIEKRGTKRVSVKSTSKEKVRLSVLMTASAAGDKLPI